MPETHAPTRRSCAAQPAVIPDRDPLDEIDPAARALILDILGIFVADALAAACGAAADEQRRERAPDQADARVLRQTRPCHHRQRLPGRPRDCTR